MTLKGAIAAKTFVVFIVKKPKNVLEAS